MSLTLPVRNKTQNRGRTPDEGSAPDPFVEARRKLGRIFRELEEASSTDAYPLKTIVYSGEKTTGRVSELGWDLPGLTVLSISNCFNDNIRMVSDSEWNPLRDLLKSPDVKASITLFSCLYRVPIRRYKVGPLNSVNQIKLDLFLQLQPEHALNRTHPHTVFMDQNGSIQECKYYGPRPSVIAAPPPMRNIEDTILHPDFEDWLTTEDKWKEVGWPGDTWDPSLEPWLPRNIRGTPLRCENCGLFCDPYIEYPKRQPHKKKPEQCSCNFSDIVPYPRGYPLIEVFATGGEQPDGSFPRGVRALEEIKKGTIVGEYVGVAVPFQKNELEQFGCDNSYAMNLPIAGPEKVHMATIVGGVRGNWTRFMNDPLPLEEYRKARDGFARRMIKQNSSVKVNMEFSQRIYAGRNRLVFVASRDIEPLEELFTDYGEEYFQKPRQTVTFKYKDRIIGQHHIE